jgi:16S rRNA A1518/A1519 N6-dimethyltransferase RsmA/KsgA/DIM1 with predicted DNA glycosylase/AP lyase activity
MYNTLKTAYTSNIKNSYVKENFTNSKTIKNCINNFYNLGTDKFKKDFYDSREIPERMSVFYFLESNNKVLEIGGSVGGVSEIIATKLNNPKNLVVLEPSNESFIKLESLAKKYNFNVFKGPLVNENENLNCVRTSNNYYKCENVDFKVDNNVTFKKLEEQDWK